VAKIFRKIKKKIVFDLSDLKLVAKRLDLLNLRSFVFTVGGTNGKGTTCAMLENLLLNAGYTVGLYTSPHLLNFLERVKINGCFVSEEEHVSSFISVESARRTVLLTYFEFITLSAFLIFQKKKLDVIILEVGLGGRLDATNIVDSNLSIITNIAIEHTDVLGKDRSSIACEKSGIFRKEKISVIGENNLPDSIYEMAEKKQAILKIINLDWFWKKTSNSWNFIHPYIKLFCLPLTQIPLCNASVALASFFYAGFRINETLLRNSIDKVLLPGRFQKISCSPQIIIDVAHNPSASLYLSKKINQLKIQGKLYAILGMLNDKDILGIINPLKRKVDFWYAAPLKHMRTANIKKLKKFLPIHKTIFLNSIHESWKTVQKIVNKKDIILVFGSFFTVSEFILAKSLEN